MSTCPHCGGSLDDGHRCHGLRRRRVRRVAVVMIGGFVGSFVAMTAPPHPRGIWVFAAGVIGMFVANAVWRD